MSDGTRTLYRPVGLKELELILEEDGRRFPPRLPEQPIFYPVTKQDYACSIASEWNTVDASSGFAGFVTKFDVSRPYVDRYEEHIVGAREHAELWVPAEELSEFNEHIVGRIQVPLAFYGSAYEGPSPVPGQLDGYSPDDQFLRSARTMELGVMDVAVEASRNWLLVFCNFAYWASRSYSPEVDADLKARTLQVFRQSWKNRHPDWSLPEPAA